MQVLNSSAISGRSADDLTDCVPPSWTDVLQLALLSISGIWTPRMDILLFKFALLHYAVISWHL